VPIYSSSHHFEWEAGPSGAFAPLFDAHGVHLAFENHVHAFKRTVPLRGHRPSANGTAYLGDGRAGLAGLGVPDKQKLLTKQQEPRLAVDSQARNHFWLLHVGRSTATLKAVDPDGAAFDTYEHTLEPPPPALPPAVDRVMWD